MCIIPQSQALWCASHRRVKWWKVFFKLCGVHLTTDSSSTVWCTPRSQYLTMCLFWFDVLQMLFICEAWRYYYENNAVSHELLNESFLLQKYFKKIESKGVTNTKIQKRDIFEFFWLRSVHPTAELSDQHFSKSSAVCIPLQSQAPRFASHRGVKMHTAESKSKSLLVPGCF